MEIQNVLYKAKNQDYSLLLPDLSTSQAHSSPLLEPAQWEEFEVTLYIQQGDIEIYGLEIKQDIQTQVIPCLYIFDHQQQQLRVYTDMKLVKVKTRKNIQTPEQPEIKHEIVAQHVQAMANNQITQIMSCFTEQAAFLHSNGEKVTGKIALQAEFQQMLGENGLSFQPYHVVTTDQYVVVEAELFDMATASVYQLNSQQKILQLRTYM